MPADPANGPGDARGVGGTGASAARCEQVEAVERALARLPEECRQVIDLHHRRHLSFADIARLLGRPPESVRALWARAVEALQRELGQS